MIWMTSHLNLTERFVLLKTNARTRAHAKARWCPLRATWCPRRSTWTPLPASRAPRYVCTDVRMCGGVGPSIAILLTNPLALMIEQATYSQLSLDFFRHLPIPGAHLIVEMYEWYHQGCPGTYVLRCGGAWLATYTKPSPHIYIHILANRGGPHPRSSGDARPLPFHAQPRGG
jgi:hypothetical protein